MQVTSTARCEARQYGRERIRYGLRWPDSSSRTGRRRPPGLCRGRGAALSWNRPAQLCPGRGERMKVLVTGAAGFIGAHCVLRLLRDGHQVCGLDNFNDYYSPALKRARVRWVKAQAGDFPLFHLDLADNQAIAALFAREQPEVVIHLAAQAGVRYSLDNPHAYVDS